MRSKIVVFVVGHYMPGSGGARLSHGICKSCSERMLADLTEHGNERAES